MLINLLEKKQTQKPGKRPLAGIWPEMRHCGIKTTLQTAEEALTYQLLRVENSVPPNYCHLCVVCVTGGRRRCGRIREGVLDQALQRKTFNVKRLPVLKCP